MYGWFKKFCRFKGHGEFVEVVMVVGRYSFSEVWWIANSWLIKFWFEHFMELISALLIAKLYKFGKDIGKDEMKENICICVCVFMGIK